MTIYAAGVVCWRERQGNLEVLLVSRERYKDWSFPKGKQDPGELLPETATREVLEETGITLRLGRKLDVVTYEIADGQTKEVHYWASKLKQKALKKAEFFPNEEIAKLKWFDADTALAKLSYQHDQDLLRTTVNLFEKNQLETRALILLRHAKATPRDEWKGPEAKRSLDSQGKLQAKRLVSLLKSFGPKRIVTSPWRRCEQTVNPYAQAENRKIILRSQLTELSSKLSPRRTVDAVDDVFDSKDSALICSHRPALPIILETLGTRSVASLKDSLLSLTNLMPGELAVLRMTLGDKPKFVSLERHYVGLVE
jgi:8-oxo-dGTP diphosphatase